MKRRAAKAGLLLGAFALVVPARWAAAADGPPGAGAAVGAAPVEPLSGVQGSAPAVTFPPPPPAYDATRIPGAAFYYFVGRPDLGREYDRRRTTKNVVRVVGGVTLLSGILLYALESVTISLESCPLINLGSDPSCKAPQPTLWTPDIMMVAGLGMLVLPSLWSSDPVSDDEKIALARRAGWSAWRPVSLDVTAAPLPAGAGGTVGLSGRY